MAEVPDTYWDTYWERLEKKLPGEPSPVTLTSRMSRAIAASLRQPAVLGRVAIYIFLLVFLIYTTPHRLVKVASRPPMPAREAFSEFIETETDDAVSELREAGRFDEAEEEITLDRRRARGETSALTTPKDEVSDRPVEHAARQKGLGLRSEPSEAEEQPAITEKRFAWAKPAKPATAPKELLAKEIQYDLLDLADSKDEYIAAENYFRNGEYTQAIPAYQNFIEANIKANVDDDRTLRAKYQIGEAYYQIGNYSEALSNFAAVVDVETSEGRALGEDGYQKKDESHVLQRSKGKYAKAPELKEAEMVSKLKAEEERGAKSGRARATRGMKASDDDFQRGEVRAGLEPAPTETREELISRAIFRQAESYEHLGKRKEALTKYEEYVERYPQGKFVSQAKEKIARITR
jgi:tetratricopeptide (TPR) repeat protein